jgi:hypothetical protein
LKIASLVRCWLVLGVAVCGAELREKVRLSFLTIPHMLQGEEEFILPHSRTLYVILPNWLRWLHNTL